MSEQKKESTKEQLQRANSLITAQRYNEACNLLAHIDHPQAKIWLEQLQDKQKTSTPSGLFTPMMLVFGASATLVIIGAILAIMYVPRLIEASRSNSAEAYMDDYAVSDEEMIYSHLAGYCYHITGYGGDLCLDWTEYVLEDFHDTAVACITPYLDIGLLEEDDYALIGECIQDSEIPDPL